MAALTGSLALIAVIPGHGTFGARCLNKALLLGRLFAMVCTAAFIGGLMEARHWHMGLTRVMIWLSRLARLPESVGLSMPVALYSNAAANSILVSNHASGAIATPTLIVGGMANSYLAYFSHSVRVMIPVVSALGLIGGIYFAVQLLGGLLVILAALVWHRTWVNTHETNTDTTVQQQANMTPLPWGQAVRVGLRRALALLFRLLMVSVPFMLGVEWLLKSGALQFWEESLPEPVSRLFPAEMLSVVGAQMGGLVQAATVAAGLRAEGLIGNVHILLAMLVGSAVGNPFRTLRRNLPTALGIFPTPVALVIVLGMQVSRFLVTVAAIAGITMGIVLLQRGNF